VLAASSSARASLFARYGPSIGPRLALASSCERIRHAITFLPTESFRLNRNDSIGSVVLAASSSARASLFARYGPSIGPRLALASSCERIRHAIPFLPTESFRLNQNDAIGSVVLAASSSARASLFARSWSQPWAFNRPAPRSRLVLRKNPPRHPYPSNGIVPAEAIQS
jgi:hypothetical protein